MPFFCVDVFLIGQVSLPPPLLTHTTPAEQLTVIAENRRPLTTSRPDTRGDRTDRGEGGGNPAGLNPGTSFSNRTGTAGAAGTGSGMASPLTGATPRVVVLSP